VPIEAKGSSTGFKALKAGRSDLAASSRPIKSEEVKQLSHLGLMTSVNNEHIVAIDGLAIIVHPSNPLSQLPLQAVQNIFSGKVSNWSQVGGRAGAISIYARDDQSGTYDTFKRLVLNKASLHRKASRFESNDDLSDAVQQDEAGIGFVALPSIGAAKALAVSDGVATPLSPSEFSVATEDYPLSRRLYFYGADHASRKPVISDFINFMRSDAGQAMVADSGYVAQSLFSLPVPSGDSRLADWQRMNLNIRFVDGAADLDNKSIVDVERLADFLSSEANANRKVTLVGFSNPRDGVSQASLSRLRAQNVRWALRNRGIRNKVGALAGNAVAVSDPSSLNAQRNRRVEVWVR
jgi:phosphate transport system substrate-binding protein